MNIKEQLEKNKKWLLFIIWAIAFICRIVGIAEYQPGIHADEASIGYDAYCIANYGVDRHLNSFPVLFPGFGGGGHSALYTYCCALLVKIAGSNIYTLRLPAIIFSMITIIAGTLIVREIFHNLYMELGYALLASFTPYFFLASRFGLDCNLMLGTSSLFLLFFIKAASSGKRRFFILAGVAGGLVLYTYSLAYLVVPFFLCIALWYVVINKRITIGKAIMFVIPLFIMAVPLLVVQYVNITGHPSICIGPFTFPALNGYRGSELSSPQLASFAKTLFVTFFYDEIPYNSNSKWLNLYIISVPFLIIGLFTGWTNLKKEVKEKKYNAFSFTIFWIIAEWVVGSMIQSGSGTNVNRMNGIFMSYVIVVLYGIRWTVHHVKQEWRKVVVALIIVAYSLSLVGFTLDTCQDHEMKIYFDCNYEDGIRMLEEDPKLRDLDRVMIVRDSNPIFYRYAAKLNPFEETDEYNITGVTYLPDDRTDSPKVYVVDHEIADELEAFRTGEYTEKEFNGYSIFYEPAGR